MKRNLWLAEPRWSRRQRSPGCGLPSRLARRMVPRLEEAACGTRRFVRQTEAACGTRRFVRQTLEEGAGTAC